jgi:dolichol-phosphate mannosyltransferase
MAFVTALIAIGFGAQAVYSYFFLDGTVKGWTTLISVISLVGSLQLIAIGILGEYLGQTLSESRKRPIFHIDKNKTSKSIL